MKIRHDFVSNSSSSSFILYVDYGISDIPLSKTDISDITFSKTDIIKAINLLSGNDITDKCDNTFSVYDYFDEEDRKYVDEHLINDLDSFYSRTYRVKRDAQDPLNITDCIYTAPYEKDYYVCQFESFLETVSNIYNLSYIYCYKPNETKLEYYDRTTQTYKLIENYDTIRKLLNDAYYYYGIVTNYETLQLGLGRFVIHFEDSNANMISDMIRSNDEKNEDYLKTYIGLERYKTKEYTAERFDEILFHAILKVKFPEKYDEWKTNLENNLDLEYAGIVGHCLHEG